jgi:cAMP phosphodiesterase
MKSNKALLQESGLSIEPWINEADRYKAEAVRNNDEQEAMKAKLREKTKVTDASLKKAYEYSSSKLDAMIGTIGKTSELGKQAAKLRSKINAKKKPKAK